MPPAQHPQAKFDPIPPDLDLHSLVDRVSNFHWVLRISAAQIRNIGPQEFEKLVYLHVIHGGKPLVIEKWNDRLPKSLFSAKWLETTYDKKPENVRDLGGQTDMPMTIGHYLRSMKTLTNQWTPLNFRDERRQRLYLKDIDCPHEWQEYLQKVIPPNLFYMNENVDERAANRRDDDMDFFQDGRSAAPAGDLMSSLPEEMRAQNLMCYVGHEGTYTPAHREMCASLGQNIMIDASGDEDGEKPGSSIWFMTETKDREVVREYFLSMLGHDIEIEKHFAQINAWKKATFPVYVVEQKVGDFILVPPLAPHQVWNRGTRTVKVAWNRTTVETLKLALNEALPKARLVCRDEQYKNKAIIFFTLDKYYKAMVDMEKTADIGLLGFGQDLIKNSTRMKQMAANFKALFQLYTQVLVDEMFASKEKEVDYIEFDSNITCSYCRANIFNRFLTCKHCVRQLVNGDEDTYDICMECYAMGRSCFCVSNLSWCEQWKWSDLVDRYEAWRALIIKNDGCISFDSSPLPLELARKKLNKKSIAQVCQLQLRMRPWKDLTQVKEPSEPEVSDIEVDDNGRPKKKKYKRRTKKGDVYRCHVCQHKDYTYKLAFCSSCTEAYCYGVLYRAFDLMPQEVMQNEHWQCPKCLNICNCAACRRAGNGDPYIPKTTSLGHDTRRIADDRSIESLVDFRVHNLSWLKSVGDEGRSLSSKRMQRLQQAAQAEKAKQADLADQVPALPDSALAESLDAAMQQPATNGYAEQNAQTGPGPAPMGDYAPPAGAVNGHPPAGDRPGPAEVADMSVTVDQDQSSYPDPSVLGRVGMGYYEQDDSPDKILFDPYQMPSAESMAAVVDDEPEMSEYLKKQLRVAKRRARVEEDNDPDFRVPRTHHRKRPKPDHNERPRDPHELTFVNMDPALFAGDVSMADAPADQESATQDGTPAEATSAPDQDGENAAEEQSQSYSPNRPALRHARPKISYIIDEDGEEEFDEIVVPRSQRPPEGISQYNPEDASKDPLDLASAAIFSTTGASAATPSAPARAPNANKLTTTGKKRGRPRKSEVQDTPIANVDDELVEHPEQPKKRRGRPPRARPSLNAGFETGDNDSTADLDAQLAQQLEGFDDAGEVIDSEPATADRDGDTPALRRRGRPPRNAQTPATQPKRTVEVPSQPLMSMAERMKLKGKKFKIGQRKSSGGTKAGAPDRGGSPPDVEEESTSKPASPAPEAEEEFVERQAASSARGRGRGRGRPKRRAAAAAAARPAARDPSNTSEENEEFDPAAEEEPVSEDDDWHPEHREEEEGPSVVSATPAAIADQAQSSPAGVEPSPSSSASSSAASQSPPPHHKHPSFSPSPLVPFPTTEEPSPSSSRAQSPADASPSPSASPSPPPAPSGPTIVRLMDSDEEDGEGGDEDEDEDEDERRVSGNDNDEFDSEDDDDDDDDEDIPARKVVAGGPPGGSLASRGMLAAATGRGRGGTMAVRGRGGGRGRGRGRGRGGEGERVRG